MHGVEASATYHASATLDVDARALGWRELTRDALFSNWAGGGQLAVRARTRSRLRLDAIASAWYAHYDGADPDGALRRDLHAEGTADLEVDLADNLIAIAAVSTMVNTSTIEDFRYWKLVVRLGLAFAIGGP